jgi:hypothetical protein
LAGPRPCRADGGWADTRVAGPFVCRADFSLAGVEDLLADLGRLQEDLVRYLGVRPAAESIEVYLFESQQAYREYLKQYLPEVPYRRALYLKRGGPGIVLAYRSGELDVDLRHECTHALLHASLPMVPLWIDEGLAEYFEVEPEQRAFGSPHLTAVRWNARLGIPQKMEKLEGKGDLSQMNGAEYRIAWAWIHFMLHGSAETHDELVRFLRDIEASTPPGRMSERLRHRFPDLDRRFVTHFRTFKG